MKRRSPTRTIRPWLHHGPRGRIRRNLRWQPYDRADVFEARVGPLFEA